MPEYRSRSERSPGFSCCWHRDQTCRAFVFLQVAKEETTSSETAFLVVLLKLVAAMQRKTLPEELVCLPLLALIQD